MKESASRQPSHEPLAHLTKDGREHALVDHLKSVAKLAAGFGDKFGSGVHARLAGLWHDLGKYSGDFQLMIREANGFDAHIRDPEGGPRDHSTAGAIHVARLLKANGIPMAFAIAGHHAGLADKDELMERLRAKADLLDQLLERNPPPEVLDLAANPPPPEALARVTSDPLDLEVWIRLLFSCLCDADFLDTEAFYDSDRATQRVSSNDLLPLCESLKHALDEKTRNDTEVNRVRAEVRAACANASTLPIGVFSLTVPTGGGKTLSAMAFALEHARHHGLDRVIVAIPFTSIIEQNAKVYREVFGAAAVIESHSSLDPHKETPRNRVASENWDAPIIVTTTVQLFESMLSNRPAKCRKLHNLTRSVIVLDEAQTLPGQLLPVILDVLERFARCYRTSIIICTATQPALGKSHNLPEGFSAVTEIASPEMHLFERLRRVAVRWPTSREPTLYSSLAKDIAHQSSVLAIVHRRDDARELCRLLDAELGDERTHHLSALMTPAHRSTKLAEIRALLAGKKNVRLVSTQLVEAGVDVDFPVVYRAFAGLDSLAQAAGRCNREGRLDTLGELRIFHAETEPPPGMLRTAREIAGQLRAARPDLDLFSPEAQREYFSQLYLHSDLRAGRDLQDKRKMLKFRTVATGNDTEQGFKMISNGWASPLVIAHDEGAQRVDDIERHGASRNRMRALQPFIVNVAKQDLERWLRSGFVRLVAESVHVLEHPFLTAYHPRFGLIPDQVGVADAAQLVV